MIPPIFAKIEFVSMDCDGNIIIGFSKKREDLIKGFVSILKEFEGKNVYIIIRSKEHVDYV